MVNLEKNFQYIDSHFDGHIKKLQEYLRQDSISLCDGYNPRVVECGEVLCGYIRNLGGTAELIPCEKGYPVVYGTLMSKNPDAKTIVFYSLYDVMPVDEPEWKVEPFSADIVDAEFIELPKEYGPCIVARGARNQKGPTMGLLCALETMLAVDGDIPVNIKFVIEGEEEIGSFNLDAFCQKYASRLSDVSCVWYGNPAIDEKGRQVLYGGAKGIISFELICEGEEWGGPMKQSLFAPEAAWVDEPLLCLIRAVASMKDTEGNVLIKGFYDDIAPYTPAERALMEAVKADFDEEGRKKSLEINCFKNGRPGIDLLEDYMMGPLLNVDGFIGGYTGPDIQTNLPRSGVAKMHMRLVRGMDPEKIIRQIREHLDANGFSQVKLNVTSYFGPSYTPDTDPCVDAARRAGRQLGYESVFWPRYYACVPLYAFNREPLNLPVISAGIGQMGRLHAANEYITVEGLNLYEKYAVAFLKELAEM